MGIPARWRSDCSQRPCRAVSSSSLIRWEAWAYKPRIPGTSWPSRCSARISGMPSSTIHVLWLCRRPWGVSPSLTGSQQARGASSQGCCPLPGQCPSMVLWMTALPSRRSLTVRPQDEQCPVPSVLTRRGAPLPGGGVNGFPGIAGGHDAAGLPGHAVASTTTRLPGLPSTGSYRPSQAEYAPGEVAAPVVAAVRAVEHVPAGTAVLAGACAPPPGMLVCLGGQQLSKEDRSVNRNERLPVGATFSATGAATAFIAHHTS